MQMNKTQLKMLIKECIVEVLEEGLIQQAGSLQESRQRKAAKKPLNRPAQQNTPQSRQFNAALDTPRNPKIQASDIQCAVGLVAGAGVPRNIMESILADTAATTFAEQNEHQSMMGAHSSPIALDAAGLAMAQIDPLNLPGANNWAAHAGLPDE